jgi:gas vesicle protein
MGRVLRGLTFGGIVGFVLGLLFAPQKGEATRKKLQETIEKGKDKFKEIKEEFSKGQEE